MSTSIVFSQQIRDVKINEKEIINLTVSNENPCTIVFPFPLSSESVSGGSITANPEAENNPAKFFHSEVPSIRA